MRFVVIVHREYLLDAEDAEAAIRLVKEKYPGAKLILKEERALEDGREE